MLQVPSPRPGMYSERSSNQPTLAPDFHYQECMFGLRGWWINLLQTNFEVFEMLVTVMNLLKAETALRSSTFSEKCEFDRLDGYEVRSDQMSYSIHRQMSSHPSLTIYNRVGKSRTVRTGTVTCHQ